jgi:hypothetical protein
MNIALVTSSRSEIPHLDLEPIADTDSVICAVDGDYDGRLLLKSPSVNVTIVFGFQSDSLLKSITWRPTQSRPN